MKGELCFKSEYNFLSSTLKIDHIIDIGKTNKYDYLGLIDEEVMFGVMEFYNKCKKAKIKPIIGLEINYLEDKKLCLIAKNEAGYFNLVKISSIINDKTRTKSLCKQDLIDFKDGLICIVPSYRSFKNATQTEMILFLDEFKNLFQDFYVGIEIYQIDKNYRLNAFLREQDIKRVAFNNINCKDASDIDNIDVLKAIKENKILGFNRNKENLEYTYFKDDNEKRNLFLYEELHNAQLIAKECNLEFVKSSLKIAKYKKEGLNDEKGYLNSLTHKGLEKRNKNFIKDPVYLKRLKYELGVIDEMGFNSYFLVVYDYVKFAKNNDILVGPGRGSAAGSLVSYVLGITSVNPIEHNLLFERFLNKERISMPDIDIDFQDNKRDEVITYLEYMYNKDHVAHIVTFSTLAARQVLRDVARVLGLSREDMSLLAKAASKGGGSDLKKIYRLSKEFSDLIESEVKFKEVYKIALCLEGLVRQTSIHASGIVISEDKLVNILPISVDSSGSYVVQYDMNYLEDLGLLKMDILGLKNLTIIDNCLKDIKSIYNIEINLDQIDLNDPKIYSLISGGQTSGVFQLESEGMKKTIKTFAPKSFEDLSSILALFRPGPKDFIEEFCLRKEGKLKIEYIDKSLEPILKSTYGIIVYQEQILLIATNFAGFSLGKADILRRAMSNKSLKEMEVLKQDFLDGSLKNNHNREKALEVFELILKFASYGFNKAHSVSYSIIAAWMAYIKSYYTSIFFACVMNTFVGGSDSKFSEYVSECKRNNIDVKLPSVNYSDMNFKAINQQVIYFSLGNIKGINTMFIKNIILERKEGLYQGYEDFIVRMAKYKLSKAQITTLIDAGALDEFKYNRATLKHNYDKLEKYTSLISYNEKDQIKFDLNLISSPIIEVVKESEEKLALEKDCLGVFISGFPLIKIREQLTTAGYKTIDNFKQYNNKIVKCVVMIKHVKIIKTKKNQLMSIVSCLDESGSVNVVVFPSLYQNASVFLNKGNFVNIVGRVEIENNNSLIASQIKEQKIRKEE